MPFVTNLLQMLAAWRALALSVLSSESTATVFSAPQQPSMEAGRFTGLSAALAVAVAVGSGGSSGRLRAVGSGASIDTVSGGVSSLLQPATSRVNTQGTIQFSW